MTHFVVVGAGMAGLSTAWYLQERGVRVTVVDAVGVAAGSSWGNAGQINPAFTVPLPSPGQVRYAVRSTIDPSASLMVPLTLDRNWWRFAARFMAHCTTSRWRHAMTMLTELTSRAVDAFDELATGGAAPPLRRADPLIAACTSNRELAHLEQELDLVNTYDQVDYEHADGDQLRSSEPLLSSSVFTGLRIRNQNYLDPPEFLRSLAASVRARGGEIQEGFPVSEVTDRGADVEVVGGGGQQIRADGAVIASGAWLSDLAGRFGVTTPVQAGRGYSFSVDTGHRSTHAIYLPSRKVVCTPYGGGLRVTGMMELRTPDAPPNRRAIPTIIRSAKPVFSGIDWNARRDDWCGSRPLTPDGLPLVGPTASPRVFVSGGHGMWGITHGPATGKLLADMITGRRVPDWMAHMDPQR